MSAVPQETPGWNCEVEIDGRLIKRRAGVTTGPDGEDVTGIWVDYSEHLRYTREAVRVALTDAAERVREATVFTQWRRVLSNRETRDYLPTTEVFAAILAPLSAPTDPGDTT